MKLESKDYQIYRNIDFTNRYKVLSNNFQFEERLNYSNEKAIQLISDLGYKSKYIKNGDFFKIEEKIGGIKFYFHICLKYSNTELIMGAVLIETDDLITGSTFGRLYRQNLLAEGVNIDENIKKPKFRNYKDLELIFKEAFSIYEDFKLEVPKLYREISITQPSIIKEKSISTNKNSEFELKLSVFIDELKQKGYPSHKYFEEIVKDLKSKPDEAKQRLKSSYAITQYANFTSDLESKLKTIILLA